jgi:hypothetical protein
VSGTPQAGAVDPRVARPGLGLGTAQALPRDPGHAPGAARLEGLVPRGVRPSSRRAPMPLPEPAQTICDPWATVRSLPGCRSRYASTSRCSSSPRRRPATRAPPGHRRSDRRCRSRLPFHQLDLLAFGVGGAAVGEVGDLCLYLRLAPLIQPLLCLAPRLHRQLRVALVGPLVLAPPLGRSRSRSIWRCGLLPGPVVA